MPDIAPKERWNLGLLLSEKIKVIHDKPDEEKFSTSSGSTSLPYSP